MNRLLSANDAYPSACIAFPSTLEHRIVASTANLRVRLSMLMLFAMLWPQSAAYALKSDREQAIDIVANSLEADDQKKLTIYRGDVVITQGTLRLSGETVIIHYDDQNELTKLVTLGQPAHFRQLPDGKEDIDSNYQRARASRMEYFKDQDLIKLLGDAIYGEGKSRLEADTIEYDSLNGRMKASSLTQQQTPAKGDKPKEKKRIRVRLMPAKKEGS